MNRQALLALALLASLWSARSDAAVIALSCNACSAAEEQLRAMAPWGVGYVFIYNLPGKRLRKFEIAPAPDDVKQPERANATKIAIADPLPDSEAAAGATKPIARRELWEHPVDASVQRIFDTIVAVDARAPRVLNGTEPLQIPIDKLGANPHAAKPRPYDPREIAWYSGSHRGAVFTAFVERVENALASRTNAGQISADLADVFYGVRDATLKATVDVGASKPSTGVGWQMLAEKIRLRFCDAYANCVEFSMRQSDREIRADYVDVRNRDGRSLPTADAARTLAESWASYEDLEPMYSYAEWLRAERNASIEDVSGGKTCNRHSLVCKPASDAERLQCRMDCY